MNLTKDADKMICQIYKTFLQLRKDGIPKSQARRYQENYFSANQAFSCWAKSDCNETMLELARSGLIKIYIGGNFDLTDNGIVYMENRFVNGLKDVTDFITKFIP